MSFTMRNIKKNSAVNIAVALLWLVEYQLIRVSSDGFAITEHGTDLPRIVEDLKVHEKG